MKPLLHISIIICLVACVTARVRGQERTAGALLTDTMVRNYSLEQIAAVANTRGMPHAIKPRYSIQFHAITYLTPRLNGELTTASGMVVFPVELSACPVLSYQHDASTRRSDCPSNPDNPETRYVACLFASAGYLVVAADYLGLGESDGVHLYAHAASEASACRDMLRASRALCEQMHVTWGPRLFLGGYSEGGHATLALQRLLEQDPQHEFTVTASAPQSGPYDLSDSELHFALRQQHSDALSMLTGLLLYSYNSVYQLYPGLDAIFTPQYAKLLPRVFDGSYSTDDAVHLMPPSARTMLDPDFITVLSDPSSAFSCVLQQNNVYDWRPIAPVTFYYIGNDAVVSPDNTHVAFARMHKLGATVKKHNLGGSCTHATAFYPAQWEVKGWFDKMR